MAAPGQRMTNPITGEAITFVRTGAQTGERALEMVLELRPAGLVGGLPHRHPQRERFQVEAGVLAGWLEGRGLLRARPGEVLEVPPGRSHMLWNGALATTRAHVVVEPADGMERFYEAVFEASGGGLDAARRVPGLARRHEVLLPLLPAAAQRRALGALARRLGAPA
jgi:quercetin dioxygenase-like cupin family protein